MTDRKRLYAAVHSNLELNTSVSVNSSAIVRATDIMIGITGELNPERGTNFRIKYADAIKRAKDWKRSVSEDVPPSDAQRVAAALVKYLEEQRRRYNII